MIRTRRKGLTLIEVLVIIVIVLVGIGLFLPATRRVREPAARMSCQNNLKQLMIAFQNYESMTGSFPPGCLGPGVTPEERLSWVVPLLPYLEQDALHKQFNLEKGYAGNLPAAQSRIRELLCPSAKEVGASDGMTHYVALSGIGRDAATHPVGAVGNGFMGYDRQTSLDMIRDGTSNTIALIETCSDIGPWARGGSSTLRGFDPAGVSLQSENAPFGGLHSKGMNVAMVDGSIRFVSSSIDPQKLAAVITIAGGEQVDPEWELP